MGDADFDRYDTDLGLVLKYVKHSGSKKGLRRTVEGDPRYRDVDLESARFMNAIARSDQVQRTGASESVCRTSFARTLRANCRAARSPIRVRESLPARFRHLPRWGA